MSARAPRIGWFVAPVLAALALASALLVSYERRVLFPAPHLVAHGRDAEVQVIGDAEGLFLPPRVPAGPAPALLFFHGNAELADDWLHAFDAPRDSGWAVLLVEYPGYGRCAGAPSERSIDDVALAAFDRVANDPRVDPRRIVAVGRSLGGGPAVAVATRRPVAALVLLSAFTSVRDLAARAGVPGALVVDAFDNAAALRRWRGPMLVVHGVHDQVIPFAQGERLARTVPGAALVPLACGHNDWDRDWSPVLAFLRTRLASVAG